MAKISEQIRREIETCGISCYRIAIDTGVDTAALSRFLSRERGLSMEALDSLAEYFGYRLTKRKGK